MATLSEDMKRVVREQRLGFYATVCEDGSPNLSPKGTTYVWDDEHLFFADIRSPQTLANIRRGSLVEVNVVDPLVRKGYRFKGPAVIHEPGTTGYADGVERLRDAGSTLADRAQAIVVLEVREAAPLVSPVYDDGAVSEADVSRIYRERFARVDGGASADASGDTEPAEVMRRYADAARRGDFEKAFGLFADDVVLRIPGRSSLAGEHRGREAAIHYIQTARALSEHGDVTVEVVDSLTSSDRFALIVAEHFHRPEGTVTISRSNVYRVRAGQIVEVWIFEADQYAVDDLMRDPG